MTLSDHDDFARAGGFGGAHLLERLAPDLLGICRGILMDGAVVDREISELNRWCETNPAASRAWPGGVLAERLRRATADGTIDEDERGDLHLLLEEVTGYAGGHQRASQFIFTVPPPEMVIIEEYFTLTGRFLFGPRRVVTEVIELIGGYVSESINRHTQYLVVGGRATPAWLEANRGTKIMAAMELNGRSDDGPVISIVSEEHWSKFIRKPAEL